MFKNLKIRTSLLIGFFVIAAIPLLFVILFSIVRSQQALSDSIRDNLTEKSDLVGAQIDAFFRQREVDIKVLSQSDTFELDEGDEKHLVATIKYLTEVVIENPAISDLDVFHVDGRIEASSGNQNEAGLSFSDLQPENVDLFDLTLKAKQGDVYFSEVTEIDQGLGITLLTPITDESNIKVIKVLVMEVSLELIEDIVSSFDDTVIGDKYVYLIDNDGNVLVTVDPKATILESLRDLRVEPNLLQKFEEQGEVGSIIYIDAQGDEVLAAFADMDEFGKNKALDWSIFAVAPLNEITRPVTDLRNILLIVALIVLVFVIIFAYLFSRSISEPISEAKNAAIQIAQGNMDVKVNISGSSEVRELSQAIDKMRQSLKSSFEELKGNSEKIAQQLQNVAEEKENVSREKDKINTILESIGDGVFVVDRNYKIIIFNQVASKISGFTAEEAMGKTYDEVLRFIFEKSGKINDKFIKETMSTGEIKEMSNHTLLIRKDGEKVPVADSAAPFKDKEGQVRGVVVVFRDVTKERGIDNTKTEFISVASHQLRTPVSAINWLIESLQLSLKGLDEKQKSYLNDVSISAKRLTKLVEDLLNTSRLELGTLKTEKKELNIIKSVEEFIESIKDYAISKKHTIVFNKESAEFPAIVIDPKTLYNVLQNLVSNAVDYSPPDSEITIDLRKENNLMKVSISNKGPNISKEDQVKLFQKFYRAPSAQKMKTEGTGLGLYIVKNLIEQNGGKVGFRSEEGEDTVFWFTIPLKSFQKVEKT